MSRYLTKPHELSNYSLDAGSSATGAGAFSTSINSISKIRQALGPIVPVGIPNSFRLI